MPLRRAATALTASLLIAACAPPPAEQAEAEASQAVALARTGRVREAIPGFERAVALDANNLKARYNLGIAFLALGRPVEAAAHLERFVALRPADALGQFNLARAYAQQRRAEDALAALQAAVNAGYADYREMTTSGGLDLLHHDVRYLAVEALVAQRAGVKREELAGALGKGVGDYGGIQLPGLKLPTVDQGPSCAREDGGEPACSPPPGSAAPPATN